jgi:hypothetical protein
MIEVLPAFMGNMDSLDGTTPEISINIVSTEDQ